MLGRGLLNPHHWHDILREFEPCGTCICLAALTSVFQWNNQSVCYQNKFLNVVARAYWSWQPSFSVIEYMWLVNVRTCRFLDSIWWLEWYNSLIICIVLWCMFLYYLIIFTHCSHSRSNPDDFVWSRGPWSITQAIIWQKKI